MIPEPKSTFKQAHSREGGLTQVRESNLAKKEHRLRDLKNATFFTQSMKNHSPNKVGSTMVKPGMTNKPDLWIAPHNILYQGNTDNKGLAKGMGPALMQSILSPTMVEDDDHPYSGIAMPEYQPTVKMTKVISESTYTSQKSASRLNSVYSRPASV